MPRIRRAGVDNRRNRRTEGECRSGHCYLQLVEKGGRNGVPQAQVQAVIWAGQYGMLSSYFRGATGEELAVGMKVLLHVTVTYHGIVRPVAANSGYRPALYAR